MVAAGSPPGRGGRVVSKALGSPWRDVLAALGAATTAVTGRFGVFGVLGSVTAWQVAAACSVGRLLSPGWPPRHLGGTPHRPPGPTGATVLFLGRPW
ncbi:MAG: hypothetical protein ACRDQ4_23420 [Pseudonocardiaceae bacterium]